MKTFLAEIRTPGTCRSFMFHIGGSLARKDLSAFRRAAGQYGRRPAASSDQLRIVEMQQSHYSAAVRRRVLISRFGPPENRIGTWEIWRN